jgi:fumarate hydratase subunit beta
MICIEKLKFGDSISYTGELYTARDAAHKRLSELLEQNKPLPIDLSLPVYYTGPCPASPDRIIGSCGPTTSLRMDKYSPRLIKEGLRVMIGKGERGQEVIDAIKQHKGIYLSAVGGAGALLSLCVKKSELIAFEDLGTEAIYKLTVKDMPLTVAIDCHGGSIYER